MRYDPALSLAEIDPPAHAVRVEIDESKVNELAESLAQVGLLNPIHVKAIAGRYEVVAGHRRYMAACRCGWLTIAAFVLERGEDLNTAAKIHENLFREDISPIEEAAFYAELLPQFENDTDKLAAAVRRRRAHVEGRLELLRAHPAILDALAKKLITLGVAQELATLKREVDVLHYLKWSIAQGANRACVASWAHMANLSAELNPEGPPGELPPPPPVEIESKEPVCYLCGYTEPRHDVEFWYIHRACRQIVEHQKAEMARLQNVE